MAEPTNRNKDLMDEYKRLLAVQIKLDIAKAIRHDPRLMGEASVRAYEKLAAEERIDGLVRELAYEETVAAIDRGDVPAAAMLMLAGFKPNPALES